MICCNWRTKKRLPQSIACRMLPMTMFHNSSTPPRIILMEDTVISLASLKIVRMKHRHDSVNRRTVPKNIKPTISLRTHTMARNDPTKTLRPERIPLHLLLLPFTLVSVTRFILLCLVFLSGTFSKSLLNKVRCSKVFLAAYLLKRVVACSLFPRRFDVDCR